MTRMIPERISVGRLEKKFSFSAGGNQIKIQTGRNGWSGTKGSSGKCQNGNECPIKIVPNEKEEGKEIENGQSIIRTIQRETKRPLTDSAAGGDTSLVLPEQQEMDESRDGAGNENLFFFLLAGLRQKLDPFSLQLFLSGQRSHMPTRLKDNPKSPRLIIKNQDNLKIDPDLNPEKPPVGSINREQFSLVQILFLLKEFPSHRKILTFSPGRIL